MLYSEGVRVRAGEARRGEGNGPVADAVAVAVRIGRVGSRRALVEVRDPVVVVVLVLDQVALRGVVVVGQLVGEAVAVGVLEDLDPEDGLDRRPVGLVRPHGERGSAEHLCRRAVDHPPDRAQPDTGRQVGLHLIGRALGGALRLDALHPRVPEAVDRPLGGLAERVAIWPRLAYRGDGVGPVADPVEVGVGVQGVSAGVGPVDVDAGVRLDRVIEAVSVVVGVLDEGRDGRRCPRDRVRHAVAVGVRVRGRVGREGVGAGLADAGHCLRAVAVPVAVGVRACRVVAHRQLVEVGDAVVVVVLVDHESRGGALCWVVVTWERVW